MAETNKRGSNGGNARAEKLTKEQRSEIAKNAAQRRWAKPKEEPTAMDIVPSELKPFAIRAEVIQPQKEYATVPSQPEPIPTPPDTFTPPGGGGRKRCFACLSGQDIDSGRHILGTVDHPVGAVIAPIQPPQEAVSKIQVVTPQEKPQKAPKRPTRPMPKEFKGASSYADKRLAEAIKERAEAMGKVAALNAEIPSLVAIIRALGGTPNVGDMAAYAPMPYQQPYPQQPMYQNGTPPIFAPQGVEPARDAQAIDPGLYAANSGPLPGLVPAAANAPLIPNTSAGGAMDLDYQPEPQEGPGLPRMGGGWV